MLNRSVFGSSGGPCAALSVSALMWPLDPSMEWPGAIIAPTNKFHFLFPLQIKHPEGFAFHFLENKVQLNLYFLLAVALLSSGLIPGAEFWPEGWWEPRRTLLRMCPRALLGAGKERTPLLHPCPVCSRKNTRTRCWAHVWL